MIVPLQLSSSDEDDEEYLPDIPEQDNPVQRAYLIAPMETSHCDQCNITVSTIASSSHHTKTSLLAGFLSFKDVSYSINIYSNVS